METEILLLWIALFQSRISASFSPPLAALLPQKPKAYFYNL